MTLVLDRRQRDAVRRHAEADYPREACGLIGGLVEDGRRVAVRLAPMRNARDLPRNRYRIDPEAFLHAERQFDRDGLEIVGVYHSHPDAPARPSTVDRDHAWPWLSYVIVAVTAGKAQDVHSWTLTADRASFTEEDLV